MQTEWKEVRRQYTAGEELVVGNKWTVAIVNYDGTVSRDDTNKYKAICKLPGIKDNFGHFATEQEAKEVLERAVNYWFDKANAEY